MIWRSRNFSAFFMPSTRSDRASASAVFCMSYCSSARAYQLAVWAGLWHDIEQIGGRLVANRLSPVSWIRQTLRAPALR